MTLRGSIQEMLIRLVELNFPEYPLVQFILKTEGELELKSQRLRC